MIINGNLPKSEMNEIFPSGLTRQIYVSDLQQVINSLYVRGYLSPGAAVPIGDMEKVIYDTNDSGVVDLAEDCLQLAGTDACDYATIEGSNKYYLRLDGANNDPITGIPTPTPNDGDILIWNSISSGGTGRWVPAPKAVTHFSTLGEIGLTSNDLGLTTPIPVDAPDSEKQVAFQIILDAMPDNSTLKLSYYRPDDAEIHAISYYVGGILEITKGSALNPSGNSVNTLINYSVDGNGQAYAQIDNTGNYSPWLWNMKSDDIITAADVADIVIDGTEDAAGNAAKINELLGSLRTAGIIV